MKNIKKIAAIMAAMVMAISMSMVMVSADYDDPYNDNNDQEEYEEYEDRTLPTAEEYAEFEQWMNETDENGYHNTVPPAVNNGDASNENYTSEPTVEDLLEPANWDMTTEELEALNKKNEETIIQWMKDHPDDYHTYYRHQDTMTKYGIAPPEKGYEFEDSPSIGTETEAPTQTDSKTETPANTESKTDDKTDETPADSKTDESAVDSKTDESVTDSKTDSKSDTKTEDSKADSKTDSKVSSDTDTKSSGTNSSGTNSVADKTQVTESKTQTNNPNANPKTGAVAGGISLAALAGAAALQINKKRQ